jgi:YD repeat-containing protein
MSNIIDGWQQVQVAFSLPIWSTSAQLLVPPGYFIDDLRVFPASANMKSFVYNPVNEKLMATLDENNFATMYEYDQEGNLVRVKKETAKGIMTVSESRSGNPKQ